VARLVQVLPGAPFERIATRLRELDPGVLFPEEWVSPAERRAAAERAEEFAPPLEPGARLDGVPVAGLARESVEETRAAHARTLAWEPVVANLAAAGVRPGVVIHPFEGHSWERALRLAATRHLPGAAVVASDMASFSKWLLSLYPTSAEVAAGPFPDRVVTGGSVLRELLVGEGYPAERVRVGAALRHAYLHGLSAPERERPGSGRSRRALVATGIDFAESVELVGDALAEFGSRPGWEVVVKAHPALERDRLRDAVRELAGFDATLVDSPVPDLLPTADVLLYAYTSVCWEALAFGVLPVFVRPEGTLPLDKLEPFPELTVRGAAGDGLAAAVEARLGWDDAEYESWRERGREALELAMAPPREDIAEVFLGDLPG
jgi:surface carbohydrate biosynthesis protein (TIGR04326 family)